MVRGKWKKRIAAILGGSLALGIIVILWLGLAATHIPSWYNPPDVPEAEYQQVRDSLTSLFAEFSDNLIRRKPFEILVTGEQVSKWLSIRASIWTEAEDWLPPELTDPVVVFQDEGIHVGARAEKEGWQAIASLNLSFDVETDWITIRLDRIAMGSLSIPQSLVAGPLDDVLGAEGADVDVMPDLMSDAVRKIRDEGGASFLEEGFRIENRFHWQNGKRWFKVNQARVEDDSLILLIEPLN